MDTPSASPKELFVLGMLSIRPTYGHEIMRTLIESHADLWVTLSEKHVYYILKKLEREGLVDVEIRHEGTGPSRKVFSATGKGREEFERLIRADSIITSIPYSDFDVIFGMLIYTDRLKADEKTAILKQRVAYLESVIAEALAARKQAGALTLDKTNSASLPVAEPESPLALREAPAMASRVFDRLIRVAEAESRWLQEVLSDLSKEGWPNPRTSISD